MANFVLVHGSYQGGWIWTRVAAGLRAAGHEVHAPTLDGCAERRHAVRAGIGVGTHADEVAGLLFYEDLRGVVLVGTSSGGMVVCKAADQARERIARVAFDEVHRRLMQRARQVSPGQRQTRTRELVAYVARLLDATRRRRRARR